MADRYWVGGTGTWTTTTTNWSASSGGASGASAPTAADNVIFDQAATYTVTMTGALACLSITVSAGTVTFATGTTPSLTVSGSMSLVAATVWSSTGTITFNSTTSRTITTNGVTINGAITFNGVSGNWSLASALTLGATLTTTLTNGTITLNGFDLTTGSFSSSGTGTRSIAFGSNNIILAHTTAAQSVLSMATTTGFTFTGTGGFVSNAVITRSFVCGSTGGSPTNAPNLSITSGAAIPSFTSGSFFKNLDFTGSTCTPATTTLNIAGDLTLASGGTYTNLTIYTVGTARTTIIGNNKTLLSLVVNNSPAGGLGGLLISDILNCVTFYVATGTFNFTSGTLNATDIYLQNTAVFIYDGTATLGAASTFISFNSNTAGSVTFNKAYSLTSTGVFTLSGGTLNLNANLTTGSFTSVGNFSKTINFNTYDIILAHTTAATVVLSIPSSLLLVCTGTGKFVTDASITRTYTVGTTALAGDPTNWPSLSITSGTAVPTFTSVSGFKVLDFTGSSVTSTSSTFVLVSSIILSVGGTFTNLGVQMEGTGSITTNGKTISDFYVNVAVTTLNDSITCVNSVIFYAGSLNCSGYNITASATISQRGATLTNIGTFTCATWQIQSVTFNFTQGTINPSVSVVVISGGFNYNGGTLGSVPTFTHTAGTVTLNNSYALTSTGTYTFNGGQLNLGNYTLTTAIFNASGAGTSRSIDFGVSSILEITGNSATVLNLSNLSGYTGTVQIICTYVGSVGTRTITIGSWSQSTAFDFKCSACVGIEVYGGATDVISPGGNVLNFDLTGMNFTLSQGAMTIYGDYTIPSTGGSVTATASTTTFGSTNATARTITISRPIDFPITISGIGGTVQLGANLTITGATRMMSLLFGTLSLNGYDLSVGYFSSNNSNTRAINFGASNSITVTGTATPWDTTITTGLTVTGSRTVNVTSPGVGTITLVNGATEANAFDFNFSGTTTVNFLQNPGLAARNVNFTGFTGTLNATGAVLIYGSYTLSASMTVVASSNIMTFGSTLGGTNVITTNGKTMPPMLIGESTFNLGSALTSSGAIQITGGTLDTTASNYAITCTALDSSVTTNTRAIILNGSTVTVSGTAGVTLNSTNLTFNGGTSQITLSNDTSTVLSMIGAATFYNVSITGGAPAVTVVGTNNYNNLTFTNGSPCIVTITGNQTVGGALTNSSTNALTRLQLQSSISATQIILSAGTVSLTDVDFKDIDAAGAAVPFTGTRLGDLGNNTDITFVVGASKYWNLAAGGNWNAIAWATTSGGAVDVNNFPLAQDTCIIQNTGLNTSATITINANWAFGTMDMSTRTNAMTLAIGTTSPTVTGNWSNGSGTTLTGTGTVNFKNVGTTQTITASGITFTPNINYDSDGGTLQLTTSLTLGATSTFTLTKGTLSLNGFTLTTGIFNSNNSFTRSIAFGTTNIVLAHTTASTTVLDMANISNCTTTGTGQFTTAMSITRTFSSGWLGASASTPPSLALTSGAAIPTFTSGSYFTNLNFTGTTSVPAAGTVSIAGNLTLATGGTYTSLGVTMIGTGTITPLGKTIASFAVNASGTATLAAALACTTFNMTAGTLNLASFNLTCSSTATYTSGTLSNLSTITCTTWTTQGTFAHSSGTITPSVSFIMTSGSYTQSGTSVLSSVATFTHTGGNVTFRSTYSLTATGTYTLTAGTLTLGGDLTTGIFSSTNTNTRSIAFSTFNIVLAHTTLGQVVLGMGDLTNFTWTGTGGFTSAMSVTRTFQSGTTAGATSTSVPNLSLISGASIPTLTNGGLFNNLNFTGSTCAPASTNISIYGNLTLASGGSYSTFTAIMVGSAGNIDGGGSASLLALNINNSGGTTTLLAATTLLSTGITTLTSGTLNLGGNTLTTGTFVSNVTNVRSIVFGTANIILASTVPATVNLNITDATNFTYTSSGTYGSATGCFQATMSATRTFSFGNMNASGSITNAPRLYLVSGSSIATLTTGSWFKEIDFGATAFTIGTTNLNLISLKSNLSTSVLTALTATMVDSGSIRTNTQIGPLIINTAGITTTLAGTTLCTTATLTLGTLDLASQTLTCSSTFTWNNGSLLNLGTLGCTTFTLNGPTLNLTAGTLTPTTSFVLNTGLFTYGGTATLGATTTFTQNAGTVTFNKSYSLNTISTYSLVAGNLILAAQVILSTGIFSSSNAGTRTIGFGASVSSGSAVFNGTSQYASLTTTPNGPLDLASGAGNWTIETWFYQTSVATNRVIFAKGGATGSVNGSYVFIINAGTGTWILGNGGSGGTTQTMAGTFLINTWYHFALVRNGATITAYVNGVSQTPVTLAAVMSNTDNNLLTIGANSDGNLLPFAGYISNLRIVKGVAVYTGNFTVPTSPLTSTQSSGTNISAISGTQTSLLLNTVSNSFLTDSSTNAYTLASVGSLVSSFSSPFSGLINLTHTTAATVVLSMADLTNFSYTGSGGFTVAAMNNTRTFTYGTSANGSSTTSVNLEFTTGASAAAITSGSWFKTLNFGTTTSTATGTGLNVFENLYLNGTYTAMTVSMLGTGNISGGASASLLGLTIDTVGTIKLVGNLTMGTTGTTTLTQGSLILNGFTLTTGRFLSDGTGFTRSIDFGTTNIVLAHATAGTTVLSMANLTGFTWSGTTGGFSSNMSVTRTFNYGTTANGSLSTAVNLLINAGASIPTFTTGSWFNNLNFTGSTCTPAVTTLNIAGDLTLASGGTYTNLSVTMLDTATITPTGRTLAAFTVNTANTVTLAGALGCTIYTQTLGTLNFATFNLTCSSTATFNNGTLSNIGTITCTTFTINGPSFTFSSGTITPSVSFVLTSGSFTYNSPAVLSAVATFRQTAGDVTLNQAYSLTATGSYILTSGALTLGGNLTTGIFNTNTQLFRSIAFSTYNIVLAHTTAAQTVLNMSEIVNYSQTGTGGFTSAMGVTRTFTSGTQMGIPGSMSFNGTTANLLYATNVGFAYGTNIDFTWESWVFTSNTATGGAVFNNQNTAGDTSGVTAFVIGGQAYWFNLGLNSGLGANYGTTGANSIPNNTWTHVVFQRRGTDFEIYINGTLASSYTPPSPINMGASSQRLYIGRDTINGNYFAGRITNVRVVKSTAVYTGAFTTSTIPLAAAQSSGTNIAALTGLDTFLMLNSVRANPVADSSVNALSATNVAVVTNSTSPFPDAYYGQYPKLSITSGASVPTFTASSLFNTLDFTTSTCTPTGTVSINSLTLSNSALYTGLNVTCVGTGSIIQNNKTLGAFEVKNDYVGGTVTIITNPLAAGSYTQTSGTIDFSSTSLTISGVYTYVAGTQLNLISIIGGTLVVTGTYNFTSGTISPSSITVISPGVFTYGGTATLSGVSTFTQTSGSVNINKDFALTATGTYTLTSGSLTLGGNLTTGIFASNNTNVRSIAFSTYNIVLAHTTAATVVLSMSDLTNFSFTGTGAFTSGMSVTRTFTVGNNNLSGVTGPNLSINAGASIPTLSSGGWFNNLNFTGSTCTPATTTLNIAGDLTLASGGTYTNLSIGAVGTGTITPSGKTISAFVVNNGAGTTTLAAALNVSTYTQTAGTIDFASFTLTCSSTALFTSGTLSNLGSITCTTFTVAGAFAHTSGTITPSVSFVTTSGSYTQSGTSVLSSVATFTQTAGNVTFRSTYALTATGTYTLTAGTLTLGGNLTTGIFSSTGTGTRAIAFGSYNVVLAHTTAATTVLNMADITNFTPTGTGGFAADASITRTFTSGTTGGSTTNSPNLSLTGSGTAIATFTTNSWFNTLSFGTTAFAAAVVNLNVNGLILSPSGTYTSLNITAVGTGTFTSNGKTIGILGINTLSGVVTLADELNAPDPNLISGTLDIQSFGFTCTSFTSTGTGARSITGTGTLTITGSGINAFNVTVSGTGLSITGIIINMTSASAKRFAGAGGSYPTLNQGGAGVLTITGNNSFADITATTTPSTILFTAGSTQTFTNFTLSGTLGNLVTINSTSPGTQFNLSRASGTTSVGYLNIEDSNATGGAYWYADVTSFNVGNNTGWIFTAPPAGIGLGNFFLFF